METFLKAKLSGLNGFVVSSQVTFNTKANVIRGFVNTVELKNRDWRLKVYQAL